MDGGLGSRGISRRDPGLIPDFVTCSPMQSQRSPCGHSLLVQAGVIEARLSPGTFRETLLLSLPLGLSAEISVLKPSLNGDGR